MIRQTALFTALAATLFSNPVLAESAIIGPKATLASTTDNIEVQLMVKRKSLLGGYPWETISVPKAQADAKVHELLQDPDVLDVEKDQPIQIPAPSPSVSAMSAPEVYATELMESLYNDPEFGRQQIFQTSHTGNSMRLTEALQRSGTDRTVRVGVLDAGFTASNDVSYKEGFNFVSPRGSAFLNGDGGICSDVDYYPTNHGIQVASILAATPNNQIGIAGVAPNTELVVGRIANCAGNGLSSNIRDGILWMAGSGPVDVPQIEPVDVINISYSGTGTCPSSLQDAINLATNNGITVVFSAGNDGDDADIRWQNRCDNVISVAATTHAGDVTYFSNTGSTVDIAATGQSVRVLTEGDRATLVNGTSFSAPIVAGALALVKAERPNLTAMDFEEALKYSGNPTRDGRTGVGGGILDVMKLMDQFGIPRIRTTAASGVQGDREAYANALIHPAARNFLSEERAEDLSACDLIEIDGRTLEGETPDAPLSVFKVAKGEPLTPDNGVLIAQSEFDRLIITALPESELANWDFGMARCDLSVGEGCSVADNTIGGLTRESLSSTAVCNVASL